MGVHEGPRNRYPTIPNMMDPVSNTRGRIREAAKGLPGKEMLLELIPWVMGQAILS